MVDGRQQAVDRPGAKSAHARYAKSAVRYSLSATLARATHLNSRFSLRLS